MRPAHYDRPVKPRILILGAGFGGLELATTLSEDLGDDVEVTLIDKSDAFVFGYSKLDVMFGRTTADAVRLPYRHSRSPAYGSCARPSRPIDPVARAVKTDAGEHEADHLVVALGADYDMDATPGLRDSTEFYSVEGAERLAQLLPEFSAGHAVVGVCGAPYKCPPAPSEAALLLHDFLDREGRPRRLRDLARGAVSDADPAVAEHVRCAARAFAERGIGFVPDRPIASLDVARNVAVLADGAECPTTSSSECRSTAHPTSSSRAGWPSTATSRSTGTRSRRGFRTCMRSAMSQRSGRPRRASSRSARRESSPAR